MSKREHGNINGSAMNEGSRRSKRRREIGDSSSDVDVTKSDPIELIKPSSDSNDQEKIRENGFVLYTAVKDAVNKDGISISAPFVHRVSRKEYPEYYELIKQPIALEDIKKKLDHREYSSLLLVRNDFELLFANAKQFNQTESAIFQDAKELWKLVQKKYNKLVPSDENDEKKPPSVSRLMRTRLEKLMAKKDSTGRELCAEFMHLPSKKEWAIYYKEIKRPQCLDTIAKTLKRKEYYTSAQLAADVELVFSNALAFNQDHTPIWNDAITLRDYFRQLMSDMPPPYALPEYAKYSMNKPTNKIKIKPPQAAQVAVSVAQQLQKQETAPTASLTLRVPAAQPTNSIKANAQTTLQTSSTNLPHRPAKSSAVAEATVTSPKASKPQVKPLPEPQVQAQTSSQQQQQQQQHQEQQQQEQQQQQAIAPTPQPPVQTVSFINATASHYPRAPYVPPPLLVHTPNPVVPSATPPIFRPSSGLASYSTSQSPAPVVYPLNHQLKSISLRIQPRGRNLTLDYRDGVKSWAVRLVPGESSIIFSNVTFLGDNEEEATSAEEDDAEKDEDYDMDVDHESGTASPSKNNRRKGKARGRGRPAKGATKAAATRSAKAVKKKQSDKVGEIQLKLNNFVVKEQTDTEGEWNVYLPIGTSTVEVGEVGGMVWKIYTERLPDA